MTKRIVLPGKDDRAGGADPTIVLESSPRVITATTLAEEHQGVKQLHRELSARKDTEDWGDGFTAFPEFAHVLRGPDGEIVNVTPLSEIPGVKMEPLREDETLTVAERPALVPMNRQQRHKFIAILTRRLFKYYRQLPPDYKGYHPFRDGIPEGLQNADPKNLSAKPVKRVPATDGEIYAWLYKVCGARASIVYKRKHGTGIQDMTVRIE